jgi:hypothetical protein
MNLQKLFNVKFVYECDVKFESVRERVKVSQGDYSGSNWCLSFSCFQARTRVTLVSPVALQISLTNILWSQASALRELRRESLFPPLRQIDDQSRCWFLTLDGSCLDADEAYVTKPANNNLWELSTASPFEDSRAASTRIAPTLVFPKTNHDVLERRRPGEVTRLE